MSMLDRIAKDVRARVSQRMLEAPFEAVRERAMAAPPCRGFELSAPGVHVIAEIKRASPSVGRFDSRASAAEIAGDYLAHGATALSVLTERDHFLGSLAALAEVRAAHPDACLLQKDFVVDRYQVYEAKALGADVVLLIVALLGEHRCGRLFEEATGLGLTVLVEVHDEAEMASARAVGAPLVGVNNRSLATLEVSLDTSLRLAPLARGATLVSESGIESGAQVRSLREAGFHGFLVGSALMRQPDPGLALARLLEEAR